MKNFKELKEYLMSLDLGITDIKYTEDESGEYITIYCGEYNYKPINITGDSEFGVMIDVCNFLKKHF